MPKFRANLQRWLARDDIQGLVKFVDRVSAGARVEFIQVLADMRDPHATEALLREAEKNELTIRSVAAQTLRRVDPERKYIAAVHLVSDVHRNVRTATISMLVAMGNQAALDTLLNTLERDRDAAARATAALAISTLHDRRSLQPLIATLDDNDERVRVAAAGALAALGDRTALEPLMRMHESDPAPAGRDAAEQAITAIHQASERGDDDGE